MFGLLMAVKRNCIFVCCLSTHAIDAYITIDYSLHILVVVFDSNILRGCDILVTIDFLDFVG